MAKPRLLYVDDEPENLFVLKQAFKPDFEIMTANSAAEALSILDNHEFEIIIADQRMPQMTGSQFLEHLNQTDKDSIRILLTGYSDIQAVVDAINRGRIFYYCTKPWKKEELKAVLLKGLEFLDLERKNKKLLIDLSKTVKELDTFIYRASHNLKTPITSQIGLLGVLRMQMGESQHEVLDRIQESINHLQKTIKLMEILSESGYEFLKEEYTIDFKNLLEEIIPSFQEVIEQQAIEVVADVDDGRGFLSYRPLLKVVLECLLDNAISYRRDGSEKHVVHIVGRFNQHAGQYELTISDNGTGIKQEMLTHIFDAFFRGNVQSTGSGLGLFVVKKIIDSIGGRIDISSDGLTRTEARVIIPGITV